MPGREAALYAALLSIVDQVDEVHVHLNGLLRPPAQLSALSDERIVWHAGDDLADTGKFAYADGFDGVYLALDDDIVYPPGYAADFVRRLRASPESVFGWHGSIISSEFTDYYAAGSRLIVRYFEDVDADVRVDILGSGTLGMIPAVVGFDFATTFHHHLVSDIEFAIAMRDRGVPLIVTAHSGGQMLPATAALRGPSISGSSRGVTGGPLDAGGLATRLVREGGPWDAGR